MGNACWAGKNEPIKSGALYFDHENEEETQLEKEMAYRREEKVHVAGSMKLKRFNSQTEGEIHTNGESDGGAEKNRVGKPFHTFVPSRMSSTNELNSDQSTTADCDKPGHRGTHFPAVGTNSAKHYRRKTFAGKQPYSNEMLMDPNDLPINHRHGYSENDKGMEEFIMNLPPIYPSPSKRSPRKKGHRHQRSSPAILESWNIAKSEVIKFVRQHRAKFTAAPFQVEDNWSCPIYQKSDNIIQFLHDALVENFLFDSLDTPTKLTVVLTMKPASYKESTIIYRKGDTANGFYVIEEGQVKFTDKSGVTSVHSAGCSFGEMSLLYDFPRPTTATALTDCRLWKLDQYTFKSLLVSVDRDDERSILNTLDEVPFLRDLNNEKKLKLANALTTIEFIAGDRIIVKGNLGKVFYIVKKGSAKSHDIGHGQSTFDDVILGPGDFFGDHALLTGEARNSNVTALTDCTVLAISQDILETIIGPLQRAMSSGSRLNVMRAIPQLANFTMDELNLLEKKLTLITFQPGDEIPCHHLYGIISGRVFFSDKNGSLFKLIRGDYFGDLLKEEGEKTGEEKKEETLPSKWIAKKVDQPLICNDHITVDDVTTCLRLTKNDVKSIIGNDYKARLRESKPHSNCIEYKNFKLKDLTKHRMIGKGAFGKVWLVSNTTQENKIYFEGENNVTSYYALKMVSKRTLLQMKMAAQIIREKNIMGSIQHPFILELVSSFQDADYLYFVLPLIRGGELYSILHQRKSISGALEGLPLNDAKFYSAVIIEALSYMHDRKIAYRDLKPENILIDDVGYGVIADLGFAKVVTDKTYTVCGTPEYIAPEIIVSKGHDLVVDYWSFGCLLFEMLASRTPFLAPGEDIDQMVLFKRIIRADYRFPTNTATSFGAMGFSPEAMSMIRGLLVSKKSSRLGNLANGIEDILRHDWFKEINFKKLILKQIKAPYIPTVKEITSNKSSFSSIHSSPTDLFEDLDCSEQHGFANDEKGEFFWFKLSDVDQSSFKTF